MKIWPFFKDSLQACVRIVLSQGEPYVWQKFWQFTHPGAGGNAGGGNRERAPNDSEAGWPASSLSTMQNSCIVSVWLVPAMWAGASSAVCENTGLRLLWTNDDIGRAILRFLRRSRWETIVLRRKG